MLNTYWEYFISLPLSFFFCLRNFPFGIAIKIPIIIRYNVKIRSFKNKIILLDERKPFGGVRIGFGKVGCFDKKYQRTIFDNSGVIKIKGKAFIGAGSRIVVGKEGVLEFGCGFDNTSSITIICFKNIVFGKDVLTSWDILIMDTDFHSVHNITTTVESFLKEKDIYIGDHVWIGCRSTLLKGTTICDNSIVAACSVVNKAFNEESVLIAGNPAAVKKRGVLWDK